MRDTQWAKAGLVATVAVTFGLSGCTMPWSGTNTTKPTIKTVRAIAHRSATPPVETGNGPTIYGLRDFPYPYQAMLAISSDADSETLRKFNLVHEFLDTTQMTPLGRGLGLDFADSFFMYNGNNEPGSVDINKLPMSDELTWFKGVSNHAYAANVLNYYIHVGWIDTLHSYGDFSRVNQHQTLFRSQLAEQGIAALKQDGDTLVVWTDHGNMSNVDNFGAYGKRSFYNYQQGANPGSPYYHTNWTIPYGVKFVWADMGSDQVGMNSVIYPDRLPDGRRVWGFWRYTDTGYSKATGVRWNWTPYKLNQQISLSNLKQLEEKHEFSVIAQHMDGTLYPNVLGRDAVAALQGLAKEYHDGNLLVARTSRLLEYNVAKQYVRYTVSFVKGTAYIHINTIADPVLGTHVPTLDELRGLTFYTANPSKTVLEIGNQRIPFSMIQENHSDGLHPSIGIKWYPDDTTNYAVKEPGVL